jgi:hypothetical protein
MTPRNNAGALPANAERDACLVISVFSIDRDQAPESHGGSQCAQLRPRGHQSPDPGSVRGSQNCSVLPGNLNLGNGTRLYQGLLQDQRQFRVIMNDRSPQVLGVFQSLRRRLSYRPLFDAFQKETPHLLGGGVALLDRLVQPHLDHAVHVHRHQCHDHDRNRRKGEPQKASPQR